MDDGDTDPVLTIVKWGDFLQDLSKDGDYIHGFVTNETRVDSVLELYRRATKTTFCTRRSSSLQFDPLKCRNKKFCTRSFVFCRSTSPRISDDGVPFTYGGMKILECQYGPRREHRKKSDIEVEKISCNHENISSHELKRKSKQRLSPGITRKKGCPAKISVWHICRLPEYIVTAKKSVTIWQTKAKEKLLRDLEAGKDVSIESRFYISFPLQRAHTEHTHTDEAHSVHPQIIQWIDQLVAEGITGVRDVQAILKHNVQTRMSDIVAPDEQDRGYYPTLKDIANHIYKSKVKRRPLSLELRSFGTDPQVYSVTEQESHTSPSLQLDEPHSIAEHTVQTLEMPGCFDEAVCRERLEIHQELKAIRRASILCSDAGKLAELKARLKALHHSYKDQILPSAPAHRRKDGGMDLNAAPPSKTLRADNHDHAYLTLKD